MKTNHLSKREQEEYLLDERTLQMMHHLAECAECRAAINRMEEGLGLFRDAAVMYSAQSMASRPQAPLAGRRLATAAPFRWAFAALLPLLLLLAVFVPSRSSTPTAVHPQTAVTDDALLDQVDQQLSEAVPASMESLTHLVTTRDSTRGRAE